MAQRGVINVPNLFSGGGNKWSALENAPASTMVGLFVLILAGLIISGAIMLAWGLLAFLGTMMIIISLAMVLFNRGAGMMSWMFILAISIGAVFIVLSIAGVDEGMGIVDLRAIPGMEFWHGIWH